MSQVNKSYLPAGLPIPAAEPLDEPFWSGLRKNVIRVQRCKSCGNWQWGPEWICHKCHSFDIGWEEIEGKGRIFSWTRMWHPVHPALNGHGAYITVLVEIPHAGNIRMIGNLLGDPMQKVEIGALVEAVFEHHEASDPPFSLLHWKRTA